MCLECPKGGRAAFSVSICSMIASITESMKEDQTDLTYSGALYSTPGALLTKQVQSQWM